MPGRSPWRGAAPSAGEQTLFCRPVVTAPAVVRRDGTVLADAWLPDLVRLGELEAHLGDGVIEAIVDAALRERAAEAAGAAAADVLSAGHPAGDRDDAAARAPRTAEALAELAGLLADIPFALEWHVPTGKVDHGLAAADPRGGDGGGLLARGRAADRR